MNYLRTIGIGIQDFEKIRRDNLFYVDKTDFIRKWYEKKDDVTLITRPRRFGKTLSINMLFCFFSVTYADRKDLFDGLAVSKNDKMMALQGTVPSIRLSFASVKPVTFRQFLMQLSDSVAELYDDFRFLLDGTILSPEDKVLFSKINQKNQIPPVPEKDEDAYLQFTGRLTNSIRWLSGWLYAYYGKKIYIFLDEYDTPIQSAYLHHFYDEAMQIMRPLLSCSFKTNKGLDRAVITGITRIAKESLFSDLNNLAVSSIIHGGYDTDFGFTSLEMVSVLNEYSLTDRTDELRFWYDGFTVGRETQIYNPWSVTNYLFRKDMPPEAYWLQSGGINLIDHLIRKGSAPLHENLQKLLQGETIVVQVCEDLVFTDLDEDENSVWSLLVAAGYVKPAVLKSEEEGVPLLFTNHEAKTSLLQLGKRWFRNKSVDHMSRFANALLMGNLQEMNLEMAQIVLTSVSSFDSGIKPAGGSIQPENYFHGLTTGLLICLMDSYHLTSNRESGLGRYDLCLEPVNRQKSRSAYILEFKVFDPAKGDENTKDTARRARNQIDEQKYDLGLLQKGYPSIRKYGAGFRGKDVWITD